MTKSRMLPALFLLGLVWFPPAFAQTDPPRPPLPQPGTPEAPTIVTADEAIAMDRARMRAIVSAECPPGQLDDEVIVCGRRPGTQRYRVPMADPDVAAGMRRRAGDAQLHAMEANNQSCSPVGRDQRCGGGLDVIGIGATVVRGIAQALANRD